MSGAELILILGGVRSGKSRLAEQLATDHSPPWAYIATAEPRDAEMRGRISNHQLRRGSDWRLFEEPIDLANAIERAQRCTRVTLIDCLTLWLSNLLDRNVAIERSIDELIAALSRTESPVIVVSNEVGQGVVPANPLARRFRDEAGSLNRRIAEIADQVFLVVAGQALNLKDTASTFGPDNQG